MLLRTAALLAGGVGVYNFLSGQNLALDLWDWARLESRSLGYWEERWRANPERSEIVVCLTTTPTRLPFLTGTFKSLLAQTRAPRRLRLHLPEWSRREGRAYPRLESTDWLDVVACPDQGPATKLLPALELAATQPLLVVDDDRLYPSDLVARLERASQEWPGAAVGCSGWRVPADLVDRPTTLWSNLTQTPPTPLLCTRIRRPARVDILQGYSGYLVRPGFYSPRVHDYRGAPEAARTVDDVWLSAHLQVERLVVPGPRMVFEAPHRARFYKRTSLGLINRGPGDVHRRANSIALRHLREHWCGR